WDGTVRLWEVSTGKEIRRFLGHLGNVWQVQFSPDGKRLLSGSADRTARLWDIQDRPSTVLPGHGDMVSFVAFTSDGRFALTSSHDRKVRVWNVATQKLERTIEWHTDKVQGVASNNRWALTGGYDNVGRLWDLDTGDELQRLVGHS